MVGPAYLLDVNVLLALVWPFQEHHDKVRTWFAANAARHWVTCPITQAGCVRLLSNPSVTPKGLTPREAVQVLTANLRHPGHVFWPDDQDFPSALSLCGGNLQGHRQLTDAYLLGLSIHHKAHIVTMDSRISSLLPAASQFATRVIDILATQRRH